MTNRELSSPKSNKNWIIAYTISIGLILTTLTFNAQSINKKVVFNDNENQDYIIKHFKLRQLNNKLYFKFLVVENRINTTYTLESSANGSEFYNIQIKEGFKSPSGVPLLYCYSMHVNNLSNKSFRIKRISADGISYSDVIEITNPVSPNLTARQD